MVVENELAESLDSSSSSPSAVEPESAPGRWLGLELPLRFTLWHIMLFTLVAALAMAPLAMVRKHDRIESIVAMVAFETIGLPAVIMIALLLTMKPGPARLKTIVVLSLLPMFLVVIAGGLTYLKWGSIFVWAAVGEFAHGNFRRLPGLVFYAFLGALAFPVRCPACGRRRMIKKPPSASVSRWTATYRCRACGADSFRLYMVGPARRFVEPGTDSGSTSGLDRDASA